MFSKHLVHLVWHWNNLSIKHAYDRRSEPHSWLWEWKHHMPSTHVTWCEHLPMNLGAETKGLCQRKRTKQVKPKSQQRFLAEEKAIMHHGLRWRVEEFKIWNQLGLKIDQQNDLGSLYKVAPLDRQKPMNRAEYPGQMEKCRGKWELFVFKLCVIFFYVDWRTSLWTTQRVCPPPLPVSGLRPSKSGWWVWAVEWSLGVWSRLRDHLNVSGNIYFLMFLNMVMNEECFEAH